MDQTSETPDGMTRRAFLSSLWRVISVLAAGEAAYLGLRYIGSHEVINPFGSIVEAGPIDDFAPGTLTQFNEAHFFLIRFDDGSFLALYNRCTHLACVVSWDEQEHEFHCPCHGSAFDQNGNVLNPPAPRALDCFPVLVEDGIVKVDTSQRLRRRPNLSDNAVSVSEVAQ